MCFVKVVLLSEITVITSTKKKCQSLLVTSPKWFVYIIIKNFN